MSREIGMTPLAVKMALHFHCVAEDWSPDSPASREIIKWFLQIGMIERCEAGASTLYRQTDKLRRYAEFVCSLSPNAIVASPKDETIASMVGADRLVLISAFRYALGRMTYMVDHVASFIERNAGFLNEADRQLIVREISEQKRIGSLGMPMDEARWMRVMGTLLDREPSHA